MTPKNEVPILIVDDDLDDCEMIRGALLESRLVNEIHFVHDGEELMDFLCHRNNFNDTKRFPRPGLILLDLNMPKKDGREALSEIKSDPRFKQIPVIVLTTSKAEEDIYRSYNLGVNSFVTKPVKFQNLVEVLAEIQRYWLEIVELPGPHEQQEP